MSDETPQEQEEAEVAAQQPPAEEPETEATTVGDLQAPADEHPVDSTPALDDVDKGESPAAGGPAAVEPDGDPEPMHKEPGEPNARGNGGGDGTVWNGPEAAADESEAEPAA